MTTTPAFETTVLAGHGRRIGAALLDAVFAMLAVVACGAVGFGVGLLGANGSNDSEGWEALGWVLFGSFVGFVVGALGWLALIVWLVRRSGARNGQTFGKQLVGIRAVRVDGASIGVGLALGREGLAKGLLVSLTSSFASGLLGFVDIGLVGLLVATAVWYGPAFVDSQRRGLHDRFLGTRVIVARPALSGAAAVAQDDLWPAMP